nr:septum formation initiator family protein [Desulfobacterales bacterium]
MDVKSKTVLVLGSIILAVLLVFIIMGKRGIMGLYVLKEMRDRLEHSNQVMKEENQALYRCIQRLKNDPEYIENVARKELGMVSEDEIVYQFKKKKKKSR